MTRQQGIRDDRQIAEDELARARGEVEIAQAKLRAVQMRCTHPNTYRTSCMGESCTKCPDCGWSS